jgi:Potential DNA-binding domain
MLDFVESSENTVASQPLWVEVVETRRCRRPRVPLSDYCTGHILSDSQQTLFSKCSECSETALPVPGLVKCRAHSASHYSHSSAAAHHQQHGMASAGGSVGVQQSGQRFIHAQPYPRRPANMGHHLYYPQQQQSPLVLHGEQGSTHFYRAPAPVNQQQAYHSGPSYVLMPQTQPGVRIQGQVGWVRGIKVKGAYLNISITFRSHHPTDPATTWSTLHPLLPPPPLSPHTSPHPHRPTTTG